MTNKPKTRAEEIAYDVGVKDGRHGQDKCPFFCKTKYEKETNKMSIHDNDL